MTGDKNNRTHKQNNDSRRIQRSILVLPKISFETSWLPVTNEITIHERKISISNFSGTNWPSRNTEIPFTTFRIKKILNTVMLLDDRSGSEYYTILNLRYLGR